MPVGLPSSILVADVENPDCNAIMKMYDRYLGVILFTVFVIESRGQILVGQFRPLSDGKKCPASSAEWRKLANAWNCPGNAPYHCVADQHRQFGEVCVKESWVQPGFCPEYNTEAKKINVKRCQPFDGYICSTDAFQSHETYSREICLRTPKPTTTTAVPLVTTTAAPSSSPVGAIVVVVLILVVIAVAVLVWFLYLRRRCYFQITIPFIKRTMSIGTKKPSKDPEGQPLMKTKDQTSADAEKKIQRSNPCFVETRIYKDIISMLEKHNEVLVVGKIGVGKSATCVGVLEYYRDRLEWKTKHLPTDTVEKLEEKTIVLVDITFGDIPLYSRYDPKIEKMLNRLYTSTRDYREFKVLITSSSPLTSEMNIPILKGCVELNFDAAPYDKKDLKVLYERYTKRNFKIENETDGKLDCKEQTSESVTSNQDEQQNNTYKEQVEVEAEKDISTDHRTDKRNSSQNLSDSLRYRQSETGDSDTGNMKQVMGDSAEKLIQTEESISTEARNQEDKNADVKSIPGKQEKEATEISETNPAENSTEKDHPPIQEVGGVNQLRNDTGTSVSHVLVEPQLQTQMTDEGNTGKEHYTEIEIETWTEANISEFGLPDVCYLLHDVQRDDQSDKTIDVMSYLESYFLSLAESNNKLERQKYSTLVYTMLRGSTIWSGSIFKQLLGEIDSSLDPERLLVCATEMVDEGILLKRGKEYVFSNFEQIPQRLSACPTKSSENGMVKVTENVFSFSNDLILFVVIKSYATRNIQTFMTYSYLPFIMQFLEPRRQPDRFSVQLGGDEAFLIALGTGFAKRNTRENELKDLEDLTVLNEFKSKLKFHEDATIKFFKTDKDKEDDKKGNIFVRKMINHHPYLKEYYAYAEPEKFRSVPKDGFKQEVKKHPPCCKSQKLSLVDF